MATKGRRRRKKSDASVKVLIVLVVVLIICVLILIGMNMKACQMPEMTTSEKISFELPNVKGMSEEQAVAALEELKEEGFKIEIKHEYSNNVKEGYVSSQIPMAGNIKEGEKITVIVSLGKTQITMPDYSNANAESTRKELEAKGLIVNISPEASDDVKEGYIIRHLPSTGDVLETGDSVRLFVSSGAEKFELDDYTEVSLGDVKGELIAMGLKVEIIEEYSDAVEAGTIIGQEPGAGSMVKKGDTVTLYVSLGAATVTVPDVIGLTYSDAAEEFSAAGLHIGDKHEVEADEAVGTVVKQEIPAYSEVEMDTIVDVWVSTGRSAEKATETEGNYAEQSESGL